MQTVRKWLRLSDLVGLPMAMNQIVELVRTFDRMEAVFTLAKIAAEIANSDGGVAGTGAKSWTYDLLIQRAGSSNPLEDAVSRALIDRGHRDAIAHGRVIHTLMQMVFAHAPANGKAPHDGLLAFLMLALNDHIPRWESESNLSTTEQALGAICSESIFNQSFEDPLRFLVRVEAIFGDTPTSGPVSAKEWEQLQLAAFGCSFQDYFEMYLAPLLVLSQGWDSKSPPVLFKEPWQRSSASQQYENWFRSALMTEDEATKLSAASLFDDGLPRPSRWFLEHPFVETENRLLALSPWHVLDHAHLGTWAKLNAAAKDVLGKKNGSQRFTTTFGYLFERWCQRIANEAAQQPSFPDRLVIADHPGTDDEVEDVVVLGGNLVALMSVKAGLVPADSLKAARSLDEIVTWLVRFFIEEGAAAKTRGYRQGALRLLDRKIQNVRSGAYEGRGISSSATILPVIVTFDHMPGGAILYKWLGDVAADLGLLSHGDVRPLTILNPPEFEALFALGAGGHGVCELLNRRAQGQDRARGMDWFLASMTDDREAMRLPSATAEFEGIMARTVERLRALGVTTGHSP